METMKALVFKKPGEMTLESIPKPVITRGTDVIVKVTYCGICGSDVKILEGKHAWKENTVLGHEFTGTVVDVGDCVTSVKVGDRISLDNNPRCGLCDFCRQGFSSQCTELKNRTLGVFQNGGNAEYCLAPEDVCFRLPDAIDDVAATQVETLGTVLNGMNTIQMQPWDWVLILGCGPIGYLFASLARHIAAKTIITEIDPFRLGVAGELGIPVLNPLETDIQEEIKALTGGKKADIVIDAVGTELQNALDYVTPGGKILAFGMDSTSEPVIPAYNVTRQAVKILGTYIGQNTILPAIRVFESGRIDTKPFFTEVVPLEQGLEAIQKLGLELPTLKQVPKQAMKLVLQP